MWHEILFDSINHMLHKVYQKSLYKTSTFQASWYDNFTMKKIHRFLLSTVPGKTETVISDSELVHLIHTVLKLSVGEQCIVFNDGGADHLSTITSSTKQTIHLHTDSIVPQQNISKKCIACISITKRDTFEIIVQKLTELGVHTIIPLLSDRTIKQSLNLVRLQKISDEALEQSGGSSRVRISEPQTLEKVVKEHTHLPQYCFDKDGTMAPRTTATEFVYYIGPEGGWSDMEKTLFTTYGLKTCSLGTRTLRAETAAIVATYSLVWN